MTNEVDVMADPLYIAVTAVQLDELLGTKIAPVVREEIARRNAAPAGA